MSHDDNPEKRIKYIVPHEHVRMRPGMYIGGTDKEALHYYITELVNILATEISAEGGDHIWIELRDNSEIYIGDNGRGIPVDPYFGDKNVMEQILQDTQMQTHLYCRNMGGRRNIGVGVFNALSEQFLVMNYRDNVLWQQTYNAGQPTGQIEQIQLDKPTSIRGTHFTFSPDFTIFDDSEIDIDIIVNRVREIAFIHGGMRIELTDKRHNQKLHVIFNYPHGLKTRLGELRLDRRQLHEPIHIEAALQNLPSYGTPYKQFYVGYRTIAQFIADIAFQFVEDDSLPSMSGYVNTDPCEAGTHITALKVAILSCLNEFLESEINDREQVSPFTWLEIEPRIIGLISIRYPDNHWINGELNIPGIFGALVGLIYSAFSSKVSPNQLENMKPIVDNLLAKRRAKFDD